MLDMYLKSSVVWLIILLSTLLFTKRICKTKKIDYSKYSKNRKKDWLGFIVISFIPICRFFVWIIMFYLIIANEKMLDKLFNKEKEGKNE